MRGSYILILRLEKDEKIAVGKLGEIEFKKGYYCYVGSANGKNLEIEDRIRRYFKLNLEKKGNLKWHIDYLLVNPNVKIIDIIKTKLEECKLARKVENACIESIPGFGNSDCDCESHLFFHYINPKIKLLKILK
ncbi:MAG: GIY-YIG nuclease family protein [Candidatus Aenigmatarchaeota archaeon]